MKVKGQFLIPAVLLLANFLTVIPLFKAGYTQYFSSIEPVYFAAARFFADQFPNLSWAREWYLGFPLRYLPNPSFISFLALANSLLPMANISSIYRAIHGSAYVLLPVTFYLFVYAISRERLIATISALSFALLPSLTYVFPGVNNLSSQFSYPPFTLLGLVYFGSGPRVVGLGLELLGLILVLGILGDFGGLEWKGGVDRRYRLFVGGAVIAALVFLTDPVVVASFLILGITLLLSEMMLGNPFVKLERWFWLTVAAFGLSAFWFNPSYLWHLFFSPSLGGAPFKNIFLTLFNIAIIAIPLFLGFFATKFGRKKENQIWVIISLWLGIFGFLFGIYYLENWEFASEYVKFIPEIDLGVCLLIGVVGKWLVSQIRSRSLRSSSLSYLGLLGFLMVGAIRGKQFYDWLSPQDSLIGRPEYEIARWLDENVPDGERVYATGSTAFWLNALSDVHQVRGGSDISAVHPWWAHASYQIREGRSPDLAIDWLRVLGVSYVVIHDNSSAEFYHDYKFPEKFEGVLEKVYDNGRGDRVYKVGNESLVARVVWASEIQDLKIPKDGADSSAVGEYANWRMGGSPAPLEWLSNREVSVKANLEEGQALSLAISYDSGWESFGMRDGKGDRERFFISSDPIGNVFVDPDSVGEFEIVLGYSNPLGVKIGYLVTLITVVILITFPKYGYLLSKFKPRFFDFSLSDEQEKY